VQVWHAQLKLKHYRSETAKATENRKLRALTYTRRNLGTLLLLSLRSEYSIAAHDEITSQLEEVTEVMVYDAALTSVGLNRSLIDGEVRN
jgi:hypothetical protein